VAQVGGELAQPDVDGLAALLLKRWVKARYFAAFHPARRDHWVFGDRDTGRYLVKSSWTPIVRHRRRHAMDDRRLRHPAHRNATR
jgi:hypothetical protein